MKNDRGPSFSPNNARQFCCCFVEEKTATLHKIFTQSGKSPVALERSNAEKGRVLGKIEKS